MSAIFQGKLADNLKFGHILEIGAEVEEDGSWFSISLATGRFQERDIIDIGLHMVVNTQYDAIIVKQQVNENWLEVATKEYETEELMKRFKINLIMAEDKFHISINGKPLMFVKYQVPLEELNTLKIMGNLSQIYQIDHRKYFPRAWPPVQLTQQRVHFSHDMPVAFKPGHVMVIMIKLRGDSKGRFMLHFLNAHNIKRQEVHISMRFDTKYVIRTSKLPTTNINDNPEKMVFGAEEKEKDGRFPFENFSTPFKIAVGFTDTHLRVAKDGKFLFDYALRTPNVLSNISGVKIIGIDGVTVRVSSIDHFFLKNPSCKGFQKLSYKKFSK
ncbi:galectin-8-like isoform X1 [Musca autumnalis]|uniref:galectin-8-like isoform X1 n=1 Tax=Musca autumnalis TaxID=221902 RepID=UPI003CED8B34